MGGRFGEILLLFILALLLFGPNKLPDMAKALGQALNEFKKAANTENPTQSQQQQPQQMAAVAPAKGPRRRSATGTRKRSKIRPKRSR